jgi:hypothetical protein
MSPSGNDIAVSLQRRDVDGGGLDDIQRDFRPEAVSVVISMSSDDCRSHTTIAKPAAEILKQPGSVATQPQ